jgi:2-(1,2-epoxy-1,2-dihydrophenyl)acetyl-CoA isomerase
VTNQAIFASVDQGVWRIRLQRPDAHNALDLSAAAAFLEASRAAVSAEIGAVLIEATGADFCVGGDIRYFAEANQAGADIAEGVGALASTLHEALLILDALPVPVVSAVQGWCAGAGLGLALAADLVIAGNSARFRSAYTAIGFTPDLGATWQLPRIVGRIRASRMMLTNQVVSAATAAEWGLVGQVVADDELATIAFETARSLAAGPRHAHASLRQLLRAPHRESYRAALAAEATSVAQAAESPDGLEGVAAFLERRRPTFH